MSSDEEIDLDDLGPDATQIEAAPQRTTLWLDQRTNVDTDGEDEGTEPRSSGMRHIVRAAGAKLGLGFETVASVSTVTRCVKGGLAWNANIRVNDKIEQVNGQDLPGIPHDERLRLLSKGNHVDLKVIVRLSGPRTISKAATASLGLGFNTVNSSCIVTSCAEGGPAWAANIRAGDTINTVNGRDVADLLHDEVLSILKNSGTKVTLVVTVDPDYDPEEELEEEANGAGGVVDGGYLGVGASQSEGSMRPRPSLKQVARASGPRHIRKQPDGQLGLGFATERGTTIVTTIVEGLPAHNADIRVGDCIKSINGQSVEPMTHAQALELLRTSGPQLELLIAVIRQSGLRIIKKSAAQPLGLGFVTENGTSHVTRVVQGGPAWNADVCIGDRIVSVNGTDLSPLDHAQILDHLKGAGSDIEVVLAIPTETLRRSGPRTITRDPHKSLGLGFITDARTGATLVTTCFAGQPAWLADIRIGDQILSVNGTDVSPMQHHEIIDLLKSAGGSVEVVVAVYEQRALGRQKKPTSYFYYWCALVLVLMFTIVLLVVVVQLTKDDDDNDGTLASTAINSTVTPTAPAPRITTIAASTYDDSNSLQGNGRG